MKTLMVKLLSAFLLLISLMDAKIYNSAFGFSSEISDNWLVVNQETLRKNPDILNLDSDEMKKMNPQVISRIKKMAQAGQVEILYYTNSDPGFLDNINIVKAQKSTVKSTKYLSEICDNLQAQVKIAYNRSDYTTVHSCKADTIYGVEAVASVVDGGVYGTTSYQYFFNSKTHILAMTVTCKNSKCNEVNKEAQLLFKNIKL